MGFLLLILTYEVTKMEKYRITFIGRTKNALGITYKITKTVEAADEVAATLKLYDTHEHIMVQRIEIIAENEGKNL